MSTNFLFRPLDFSWKPELQRAVGEASALSTEHYVDALMMKLPAFARNNTPTLVVECGYTTHEKRLNLADEAFLGSVDNRNIVVGNSFETTSSSRSTTPLKIGYGADVNMTGRFALPHSPPSMLSAAQKSARSSALLQALEHRRRLHGGGDETYFGMLAFQNLARPPTDLVAPFRMDAKPIDIMSGSNNNSSSNSGSILADQYCLTLARIRNDEDMLRLYDEIASSSSYRDAASRLSIVCFITASQPPGSRMAPTLPSSDAPVAATIQQLMAGGTDVVVLLQQEHHKDALECFGVNVHTKFRRPEQSTVPAGVAAEHRRWVDEKLQQLQQYDSRMMRGNNNNNEASSSNPNAGGQITTATRMPSSAGVLVALSTGVGVRGDAVVLSRLTSHSSTADHLGLWSNIVADVKNKASSPGGLVAAATAAASPLVLEGHQQQDNNSSSSNPPGTPAAAALLTGQGASDWIIPMQSATRDELLRQQAEEAQQREAEAQQREQQKQLVSSRGASVTAVIQASAGVAPTMRSAVRDEVDTLEQQVALQKQALRWFQQQPAAAASASSPALQMAPDMVDSNKRFLDSNNNNASRREVSSSVNNNNNNNNNNNPFLANRRTASQQQQQPQAASQQGSPEPTFRPQMLDESTFNNQSATSRGLDFSQRQQQQQQSGGIDSPLQSSPQAVRTKYVRAQRESDDLSDAKTKWLHELDRVEVTHSSAVAKRFQAARQLAETQTRAEQLQQDIGELHSAVMSERGHVEEKSRALIALRKQLDVSDGATKRAETQLADVERQEAQRQRNDLEEADAVAQQRKREIDAWYERAVSFQREAEVQRASALARHTGSIAEERRRKEMLASERSKMLQDMSQTEASLRLNEVAVAELRRKVATAQTELQRARALHHELSVTHQDIALEQAVLSRLRLDCNNVQEQLADMEKALQATEEKNRINVHTSEEVGRFAEIAGAQTHYSQLALLRADENSCRQLIVADFLHLFNNAVRSFVRQAIELEESALQEQLKGCTECAELTEAVEKSKVAASGNAAQRKQVAAESLAKERQLELNLSKYDQEMDRCAAQRRELEDKLQVHHARHQAQREKTAQKLSSLVSTRDALLNEFLRQIDGETRRCVAQLGAGSNNSSAQQLFVGDEEPTQVTVRDVDPKSPAFVAAEYSRWCDEISDIAAAEQRVHELQDRLNAAEQAGIVSSDNVAESRQLLLHLERESEARETALRALEKEVDAKRNFLKSRRAELEKSISNEHEEAEQRNQGVAAQVQAATDALARLKKTVREERSRSNALAAEIETVQSGSAVALLLRELNTLRESNKARREVLTAVSRVGRSGSAKFHNNNASAANNNMSRFSATGVQRPADLADGTQFPPAAPADRMHYGDVAGSGVNVPLFAASEARSPEMRSVPSHGEFNAALHRARNLIDRRSSIGSAGGGGGGAPIPSPALSPDGNQHHLVDELEAKQRRGEGR